jgi:hypothetical protein
MPKENRCNHRTRILRALEHARRKRLTKGERKKGRQAVVRDAVKDAVAPQPFVSKTQFDANRRHSIQEMADEMYRKDYG